MKTLTTTQQSSFNALRSACGLVVTCVFASINAAGGTLAGPDSKITTKPEADPGAIPSVCITPTYPGQFSIAAIYPGEVPSGSETQQKKAAETNPPAAEGTGSQVHQIAEPNYMNTSGPITSGVVVESSVADAGDDVFADSDEPVVLSAEGSGNLNSIVNFTWTRLPDRVVLYSGLSSSFTTLALGRQEEIIELKITDREGGTATDTMSIFSRTLLDTAQVQDQVAVLVALNQQLQTRIDALEQKLAESETTIVQGR